MTADRRPVDAADLAFVRGMVDAMGQSFDDLQAQVRGLDDRVSRVVAALDQRDADLERQTDRRLAALERRLADCERAVNEAARGYRDQDGRLSDLEREARAR